MPTIAHVPASDLTERTTLYIDGKRGLILGISEQDNPASDEMTFWVQYEDSNGQHTIRLLASETVPTIT